MIGLLVVEAANHHDWSITLGQGLLAVQDGREEGEKHLLQTASVTRDPFMLKLVRALVDMYLSAESPEGEVQVSLPKGGRLTI